MQNLISKFIEIEKALTLEKGSFTLFALFLREDAFNKWDLVVAAPWIEANRRTALSDIARHLQASLKPSELTQLSRIVLIAQNNPDLLALNNVVLVRHGAVEVRENNFFGLPIKHAYIITSRNHLPNVELAPA